MNQTWKIIVAVIITAVVVGGGFYFWQQSKEVETPQITQETEDQTRAPSVETDKTFYGPNFSFVYPKEYIMDIWGFWTEADYQRHINPPEQCSTCQIPEFAVNFAYTGNIDQQILRDFDLPGTTLAEMSEQTGIEYENVRIGDNGFIKITVSNMFDETGYYTKHDNQIVVFRVWSEKDNQTLRNIISTLKFQ
jgi:hypothetical protein